MIRRVALITALVTIGIAPTANAGKPDSAPLPNPVDPTIVAPTSLGGVSIGQASADAEAAWGNTVGCDGQIVSPGRTCNYGNVRKTGFAAILSYDGAVIGAGIGAPSKSFGKPSFKGPLMKFRTAEGIGLGSKFKKVVRAYPDAKVKGRGVIITEGDSRMVFFSGDAPKGHVTQVTLIEARPSTP